MLRVCLLIFGIFIFGQMVQFRRISRQFGPVRSCVRNACTGVGDCVCVRFVHDCVCCAYACAFG